MSGFPAGFNSPAKLSGPCLVKYYLAQYGPSLVGGSGASTIDTVEMCTVGSSNYNAIADAGNQLSCDFTSTYSSASVSGTIACGLIAMNASLTSNSGTFTLYNAATTQTYTPTNLGIGSVPSSVIATNVLVVPNTASIAGLIVQPTSAAVAKIPTLIGFVGIVTSIFFSGLL